MLGYWQRPDATDEIIKDGWLHTGDIAVMDDEGFLRIVDRKKDMIWCRVQRLSERNRRRGDAAQRRAGSGGGGRSFRQQR